MKIKYPSSIKWSIDLTGKSADDIFLSKSYQKDAKKILNDLTTNNYDLQVEVVDSVFLDEFAIQYKSFFNTTLSQNLIDVKSYILESKLKGKYYALSLRKDGAFIGAEIFRLSQRVFSIVYQVMPHKLDFFIKTNLSCAIEYFGINYAIENKIYNYSIGKDRNVYGSNLNIGLAQYKLSIGALPYVSKNAEILEFDTDQQFDQDKLIFYTDRNEQKRLDKVLLITNLTEAEIKNKYNVFLKHPELSVTIITC